MHPALSIFNMKRINFFSKAVIIRSTPKMEFAYGRATPPCIAKSMVPTVNLPMVWYGIGPASVFMDILACGDRRSCCPAPKLCTIF